MVLGMAAAGTMAKQKTVAEADYTSTIVADNPLVFFQMRDDSVVVENVPWPSALDTQGFDTSAIWASTNTGIITFENPSILPSGEGRCIRTSGTGWGGLFGSDQPEYTPSGSFTIEGWVQLNAAPAAGEPPIFTKETSGSEFPEWKLSIRADRTVRMYLSSQNSTTNNSDTNTTTQLTVGESYHLVGVFRTSDNIPRIFINGVEDTSGSTWAFTPYNNTSGPNTAVVNNAGNAVRGDAYWQEIAFYTYALTDAQILAHYQAGGG